MRAARIVRRDVNFRVLVMGGESYWPKSSSASSSSWLSFCSVSGRGSVPFSGAVCNPDPVSIGQVGGLEKANEGSNRRTWTAVTVKTKQIAERETPMRKKAFNSKAAISDMNLSHPANRISPSCINIGGRVATQRLDFSALDIVAFPFLSMLGGDQPM